MLTIAVSSRSLFHLEVANRIFERDGQEAFDAHMRASESCPLEPGCAFPLIKKLLALNSSVYPDRPDLVEVVLLSRNSTAASKRILHSVAHHGLRIERAVFTKGSNRYRYARALGADLFLCVHEADARQALDNGLAAATIVPGDRRAFLDAQMLDDTVRIALDGDAVVFSDEADAVYRLEGLRGFIRNEADKADIPLGAGPFKHLLGKLHELQASLAHRSGPSRLHVGIVTARGVHSHARVINTLRHWGISIDEIVFAAGAIKGPLLEAFGADFFVDDTALHVESATLHNIAAARVPIGVGGIGALAA